MAAAGGTIHQAPRRDELSEVAVVHRAPAAVEQTLDGHLAFRLDDTAISTTAILITNELDYTKAITDTVNFSAKADTSSRHCNPLFVSSSPPDPRESPSAKKA